jgi:hypothetical protein
MKIAELYVSEFNFRSGLTLISRMLKEMNLHRLKVLEGKADFGADLFYDPLCRVTECTQIVFGRGIGFLVPQPKKKSIFSTLVQPFDAWTWVCLLAAFLAVGVVLTILERLGKTSFRWLDLAATLLGGEEIKLAKHNGNKKKKFKHPPLFFPLGTWYIAVALLVMSYSAVIYQFCADPYEKKVNEVNYLK